MRMQAGSWPLFLLEPQGHGPQHSLSNTPFCDFLGISGLGGVETPVDGDCNRKSRGGLRGLCGSI